MTAIKTNSASRQQQQSNVRHRYFTPSELEKQDEKQVQRRKQRRQQRNLLPKRFIYRPRVPSGTARKPFDNDVRQAIDALVENNQHQSTQIYIFLCDTALFAIQRMKMSILSSTTAVKNNEPLLSTPWKLIPEENKKTAVRYLIKKALRHKSRIRLELCQKNWIAEHLLSECWHRDVVSGNMVTDEHQYQKEEKKKQDRSQQLFTDNNDQYKNDRSDSDDDLDNFVLGAKEKYYAPHYQNRSQIGALASSDSSKNGNAAKPTEINKLPVVIPASPCDSVCEAFSPGDASSCSSTKSALSNLPNNCPKLPESFDVTALTFYPNEDVSSSGDQRQGMIKKL